MAAEYITEYSTDKIELQKGVLNEQLLTNLETVCTQLTAVVIINSNDDNENHQ